MQSTRHSSQFSLKHKFFRHIFEKWSNAKFMKKIRPVGAELFYANRREERYTDMMKLTVAFRNVANGPEMEKKGTKMLLTLN